MPGFMQGSPVSPTIQNMIGEAVAETKAALGVAGGMKSWLVVGVVILLVIFVVKKVSK